MIILGLNAYNVNSSACIVKDGKLVAAAEEERFRRINHWQGFPSQAIQYCLRQAKIQLADVDHIALNRDPKAHVREKALTAVFKGYSPGMALSGTKNAAPATDVKMELMMTFGVKHTDIKAKVHNVEHHLSHLASAFLVSPHKRSAVVSVDGFGDYVSAMWGTAEGHKITVMDRVFFPHSLGLFYMAFTQFLGFPRYGEEHKVMGMAAFGKPTELIKMTKVVDVGEKGHFKLGLKYFTHQRSAAGAVREAEPVVGTLYSKLTEQQFGGARKKDEPIIKRHENIAASVQAMYEEAFFNILNYLYEETRTPVLCLAGGCGQNAVANGKIFERTSFKDVYVPPAAGDAGGAIGAAYYVYNQVLNNHRNFVLADPGLGPSSGEDEIEKLIQAQADAMKKCLCFVTRIEDEDEICRKTAKFIADGMIVGWFQNRMEWGPQALGNRSILADPRKDEMRFILNDRIKRRDPYRPFTASILLERSGDFFANDYPSPFAQFAGTVKKNKQSIVPAVLHADGTARPQTVSREDNFFFWRLIREFEKITGVPLLVNTSFNENEPIVGSAKEALDCFLHTKMDVLVLGSYVIKR